MLIIRKSIIKFMPILNFIILKNSFIYRNYFNFKCIFIIHFIIISLPLFAQDNYKNLIAPDGFKVELFSSNIEKRKWLTKVDLPTPFTPVNIKTLGNFFLK